MPFSHPEKNETIKQWLEEIQPRSMLDIGPGAGTYADLCGASVRKTGIEIWGPYVKEYGLKEKYTAIHIADVRIIDWSLFDEFDVVFAGDVLEHMSSDMAGILFEELISMGKNVIICLPIIPYPQDEWNGNPYEAHVHTWSHDEVISFFGEPHKYFKGDVVGAYWYKSNP